MCEREWRASGGRAREGRASERRASEGMASEGTAKEGGQRRGGKGGEASWGTAREGTDFRHVAHVVELGFLLLFAQGVAHEVQPRSLQARGLWEEEQKAEAEDDEALVYAKQ